MIVSAPRAAAILYNVLRDHPNDRPFLLPANICAVVPLTFLKAGVRFEFVDIDPITYNLDLDRAGTLLKSSLYGGILYAHAYGDVSTPLDLYTDLKRIDDRILIIDDRCLCYPDLEAEPSNPADVMLYSTGYAKMVDIGYGGYAFLRPETGYSPQVMAYDRAALEATEKEYKACIAGRSVCHYTDSDWLQMEPAPTVEHLFGQIRGLAPLTRAHREQINAVYSASLPEEICLPPQFQQWRFNIRVKDKSAVLQAIFSAGLFASSHYASLAGIFAPGSCPHAEALAGSMINLFNDQHYTVEMAERTCDIIQRNL
jgi:hypothetical protein